MNHPLWMHQYLKKDKRKRKIKTILLKNNVLSRSCATFFFFLYFATFKHWQTLTVQAYIKFKNSFKVYKGIYQIWSAILNLTTMLSLSTWRQRKMQNMMDDVLFSSSQLQSHLLNHPCTQLQSLLCGMNLLQINHVLQEKIKEVLIKTRKQIMYYNLRSSLLSPQWTNKRHRTAVRWWRFQVQARTKESVI